MLKISTLPNGNTVMTISEPIDPEVLEHNRQCDEYNRNVAKQQIEQRERRQRLIDELERKAKNGDGQ
jgi:hypothetical protein